MTNSSGGLLSNQARVAIETILAERWKSRRKWVLGLVLGNLALVGGGVAAVWHFLKSEIETSSRTEAQKEARDAAKQALDDKADGISVLIGKVTGLAVDKLDRMSSVMTDFEAKRSEAERQVESLRKQVYATGNDVNALSSEIKATRGAFDALKDAEGQAVERAIAFLRLVNESPQGPAVAALATQVDRLRLPKGVILPWMSKDAPPSGWKPCDGMDGRPNLDGRFLMGTSDMAMIGTSGGTVTHEHQVKLETSNCNFAGMSDGFHIGDERGRSPQAAGLNHRHFIEGATGLASSLPPYHCVRFIIKVDG